MSGGKRILIVDDDEAFLQMLADQMHLHEEFAAECVTNGADALERIKSGYFDVIILDVGLADIDGREVCRLMRRGGVTSPIIMLTGADTDADTILGLDSGANDYITKPFRLGVLLARLRAHIRQRERGDEAAIAIGPYTLQPHTRTLTDDTGRRKIRLTDKEAAILKYLYRTGDRAVSREVLLDEVWGYNAGVTTHTLETHIYRLRQKIEPDPANARILVTDAGGYRLVALFPVTPAKAGVQGNA
jgi:DNA-binding response OmpR family regulator